MRHCQLRRAQRRRRGHAARHFQSRHEERVDDQGRVCGREGKLALGLRRRHERALYHQVRARVDTRVFGGPCVARVGHGRAHAKVVILVLRPSVEIFVLVGRRAAEMVLRHVERGDVKVRVHQEVVEEERELPAKVVGVHVELGEHARVLVLREEFKLLRQLAAKGVVREVDAPQHGRPPRDDGDLAPEQVPAQVQLVQRGQLVEEAGRQFAGEEVVREVQFSHGTELADERELASEAGAVEIQDCQARGLDDFCRERGVEVVLRHAQDLQLRRARKVARRQRPGEAVVRHGHESELGPDGGAGQGAREVVVRELQLAEHRARGEQRRHVSREAVVRQLEDLQVRQRFQRRERAAEPCGVDDDVRHVPCLVADDAGDALARRRRAGLPQRCELLGSHLRPPVAVGLEPSVALAELGRVHPPVLVPAPSFWRVRPALARLHEQVRDD
mmetsp:Transcript_23960/g.85550  ORF Transcript_23960/g.85550 Transcript_23960/m.85550 type:complete len:446 (+) Transcript_23960:619-1956(+)